MYATLRQLDTVQSYGRAKSGTRPMGVDLSQKPKDLSGSESEERGHGEGGGVYATLLQSDTLQPYGRVKEDASPGGVGLRKNPKDLSASEIEDRGHGEGVKY